MFALQNSSSSKSLGFCASPFRGFFAFGCTLIGNSDGHLKNFGALYKNGVRPELSPAYDIVCVSALAGFRGFGTNVAIDKLQRQGTLDTYANIAKQAGISDRIAKAAVLRLFRAPGNFGRRHFRIWTCRMLCAWRLRIASRRCHSPALRSLKKQQPAAKTKKRPQALSMYRWGRA